MGNDGGSIPKRDDLIKDAKKLENSEATLATQLLPWFCCSFSKLPLSEPIVSCGLGRLYNKDILLEYLLSFKEKGSYKRVQQDKGLSVDSDSIEYGVSHITTLKDVKELKLKANPAYRINSTSNKKVFHGENQVGRWVCSVTNREINGHAKFVYLVRCGHVFNDQVLINIKSNECLECGIEFAEEDIIPLNPKQDDLPRLKARLQALKAAGLTHTLKPMKQSRKRKQECLGNDLQQTIPSKISVKTAELSTNK
ncbi:hypothetical protein T552_00757 [Pneumocystis carinii B80]|uniref:Uncharacterized protein n=1 Tax=Pneumocystis carinii (strain B80) TaxID=1408658 RepID=A0A0W4ZPH8_PNEC8|nr:hypothetical protein T552_00757 [Pneumocystis carinii B80]KTW30282.1 hypothetical protein T552_00757 [Pneumocystis carinii B80]